MTKFLSGLAALAACGLSSLAAVQIQDDLPFQKDASKFMEKKLDSSREIIGGLAMEDYQAIAKAAQDLILLSHEADWNVITTKSYLDMSSDFRNSAGRLREAAHGKNIDSATLAFFEVTLNCVRCHKYVRDEGQKHAGEGIRERIREDIEKNKENK